MATIFLALLALAALLVPLFFAYVVVRRLARRFGGTRERNRTAQ